MDSVCDDVSKKSDFVLPSSATIMEVKELTLGNFATFYKDIKECEAIIRNYVRQVSTERASTKMKQSIAENMCCVCLDRKINRLLKCTVSSRMSYV